LRLRKEGLEGKGYAGGMMEDLREFAQTTVTDFLKFAPQTSRAFFELQTACVGCPLARFCTLTDVMQSYGLDIEKFFETLSSYLVPTS
jgi:hypothetical protein